MDKDLRKKLQKIKDEEYNKLKNKIVKIKV